VRHRRPADRSDCNRTDIHADARAGSRNPHVATMDGRTGLNPVLHHRRFEMTWEDVKADTKETMRDAENKSKEAWRKSDGDESLSDKVADAGDDVRDAIGNAGDEIRRDVDEVKDNH
jgi:hypothetical protein